MIPNPIKLVDVFAAREQARQQTQHQHYINDRWAFISIVLSVLIMSYSSLFSVFPILIFFALWLPLIVTKGITLMTPRGIQLCLAVPLLCLLSTLWSDYPIKTVYLGMAFLVLVVCIIVVARAVRANMLIPGIIVGVMLTLAISLFNGRYNIDPFTGSYALVGLFGSKNMIGFAAEIGMVATLSALFLPMYRIKKLLLLTLPFLFFLYCLYISRSATAIISLIGVVTLLTGIIMVMRCPEHVRVPLLGLLLMVLLTVVGAAALFDWHTVILEQFGKDMTLTGRTYLWREGWAIGLERALLGHGYSAFWVQGQPQAERYWHEFFVASGNGFHFHQTYVQALVDLGFLGVALMATIVVVACIASTRAILRYGLHAEPVFLFALAIMSLFRSLAEVDFFVGPFGMGSFLFYMILPRLAALNRA